MKSSDNEQYIFRNAVTHGRVADIDGANDALTQLSHVYRALRVPKQDANRIITQVRSSIETAKAHNQAKRSQRLINLINELQDLF